MYAGTHGINGDIRVLPPLMQIHAQAVVIITPSRTQFGQQCLRLHWIEAARIACAGNRNKVLIFSKCLGVTPRNRHHCRKKENEQQSLWCSHKMVVNGFNLVQLTTPAALALKIPHARGLALLNFPKPLSSQKAKAPEANSGSLLPPRVILRKLSTLKRNPTGAKRSC